MTSENRITTGLIYDITDALERHGYYRGDDQHADRAIGLMADLARIWEGTQDHPADAHAITMPSPRPDLSRTQQPGRPRRRHPRRRRRQHRAGRAGYRR